MKAAEAVMRMGVDDVVGVDDDTDVIDVVGKPETDVIIEGVAVIIIIEGPGDDEEGEEEETAAEAAAAASATTKALLRRGVATPVPSPLPDPQTLPLLLLPPAATAAAPAEALWPRMQLLSSCLYK